MLREGTCLLQASEWLFRGSWYVYITAHKQMGWELSCITDGCSCLDEKGGEIEEIIPPVEFLKQELSDHTFLKPERHDKGWQPTAGCRQLPLNSPLCADINQAMIPFSGLCYQGGGWRREQAG